MPSNWSLSFHPDPLQWLKSVLVIPLFPNTPVVSYLPQGKSQSPYDAYNDAFEAGAPCYLSGLICSHSPLAHSTPASLSFPGMIPPGSLCTCFPLCLELSPFMATWFTPSNVTLGWLLWFPCLRL